MNDLINRQEAIDILELGAEILRRVLDDMDVVGIDREKYSYGLKLIESNIEDIKQLPPAQPEQQYIPVTEESVIQAGYEGREVRFRLRGRLFAIRELAQ